MLINKVIFMSSLAFKLSIRFLLLASILPRHCSRKTSSLHLGSEDFDVLSPLLCYVVLVNDALMDFEPSGFVTLAFTCEMICAMSDMNSSTSWYQRHFYERSEPDRIFMALQGRPAGATPNSRHGNYPWWGSLAPARANRGP